MFSPIKFESGKVYTLSTVSETTITKGDALDFDSGYVQRATSASTNVRFVSLEDKTTAAGAHESIQALYTDGVEFEGETASTTSQALVGTYIDLTDHDTLNQGASNTNVFYVAGLVDTSHVRGYFCMNVA